MHEYESENDQSNEHNVFIQQNDTAKMDAMRGNARFIVSFIDDVFI